MGTDIHPRLEVRINGSWERWGKHLPRDRDYWAFAVLAGVRSGEGFAGVDTGDSVVPIAEPRGAPDDGPVSHEWIGDHSFSWVTLAELLALDLDVPITRRGMAPRVVGLIEDLIEELKWIPEEEGITPEDVRVVFGFDS